MAKRKAAKTDATKLTDPLFVIEWQEKVGSVESVGGDRWIEFYCNGELFAETSIKYGQKYASAWKQVSRELQALVTALGKGKVAFRKKA